MLNRFRNIFGKIAVLVGLFVFIVITCKNYTKEKSGMDMPRERKADHPIEAQFIERRSLRAMSGEPVSHQELMSLFEASRWAPSSFNDQPWEFIYAHKGTPAWNALFGSLVDFNKSWAINTGALIAILSRTTFDPASNAGRNGFGGKPSISHSFDTGAAWMSLALQGHALGLVIHAVTGFDMAEARAAIKAPEHYKLEAIIAVGKPGSVEQLPNYLQEGEEIPSQRKPVTEFIHEGSF